LIRALFFPSWGGGWGVDVAFGGEVGREEEGEEEGNV